MLLFSEVRSFCNVVKIKVALSSIKIYAALLFHNERSSSACKFKESLQTVIDQN